MMIFGRFMHEIAPNDPKNVDSLTEQDSKHVCAWLYRTGNFSSLVLLFPHSPLRLVPLPVSPPFAFIFPPSPALVFPLLNRAKGYFPLLDLAKDGRSSLLRFRGRFCIPSSIFQRGAISFPSTGT